MARPHHDPDRGRSRGVLALLLLAALTVITLDARPSGVSPVDPLRAAVGTAVAPLHSAAARVMRSAQAVPRYFADVDDLRERTAELERVNAELRAELRTTELARRRADELDRMLGVAADQRLSVVPARVVTLGPAQSFSRTVTIDAGTRDGVHADMTVLNGEGLVGRVLSASGHSATVLLVADAKSVVGGRLSSSLELGFLAGDGGIGEESRLTMELVDPAVDPAPGDTVVTWGSRNDAPYAAGVPIGSVERVSSQPRQLATTAVVRPFVDFSALDLVGVVVGTGGRGARDTVQASE